MFECKIGLGQDDVLSAVLFNLAPEKVVKDIQENREIMELIGANIYLAYADDIVINGASWSEVEDKTKRLLKTCHKMGSLINESKTKYWVTYVKSITL